MWIIIPINDSLSMVPSADTVWADERRLTNNKITNTVFQ